MTSTCKTCYGGKVIALGNGRFIPCPECCKKERPKTWTLREVERWGNGRDKVVWREILDKARAYIDDHVGKWLVIYGPSGSGKTTLAMAIAHALDERYVPYTCAKCMDIPVESIKHAHDYADSLKSVNMLILDDVGLEPPHPYAHSALRRIISHRYERSLSSVYCVGVEQQRLDPYIRGRLFDQARGRVIVLPSRDYRMMM